MPVANPAWVTALAVEAVRRAGLRAILHAGWAGLGGQLLPAIFPLEYALYGWLFSQMAGVVHHGGLGTTSFALRSGMPSLVVPFAFDQPYWGARAAALGADPPPLPYRSLRRGGSPQH
jgi:UDP:flavonoid glycosyltransferase YjiC (YdhE family)